MSDAIMERMRRRVWYDVCRCEYRRWDDESFARLEDALAMAFDTGFVTVCYNVADVWPSRDAAARFFAECMCNSEGAENDRYQEVFYQCLEGREYAHDGVTWRILDVNDRR